MSYRRFHESPLLPRQERQVSLEQVPEMYKTFRDKEDGCIKVLLKP